MTIEGNNRIELSDILIGEVWLCSGQSNMEWWLQSSAKAKQEIAAANYPEIRLFDVSGHTMHRNPQSNTTGTWRRCTPESARRFSAVGYFFGQHLFQETGVPIGLIGTNWGGTRIEPWIPASGFAAVDELGHYCDGLKKLDSTTPQGKKYQKEYLGRVQTWLDKAHVKISAARPIGSPPAPPNHDSIDGATLIYNSMVHGLAPLSVQGVIWYQGESNGEEGRSYYDKMRALIAGWRKAFENPDLAFYFVQLANWQAPNANPEGGDGWAKIREAQRHTLAVPHTGMAVTTDIGEAGDIHPKNKQDVGKRLALWALRDSHGRDVTPSGPLFHNISVVGNTIHVSFDHASAGLIVGEKHGLAATREVAGGSLKRFAIAGADHKWHWADATIDGDQVVVSSPDVPHPVAVRYAYSMNPQGANLYNKEGLPASPFRSDDW
jgi:sialate O-acetylesterase